MKNKGIIVLLSILVLLLALIGYLVSTKTLVSPVRYEREIAKVETVSNSDEVVDIEKDLNETELDNLDTELLNIGSELN